MTPKRLRVLMCMNHYKELNGFTPSYAELAQELELKSLATIHKHVIALVASGHISPRNHRCRSLELTDKGFVACAVNKSDKIFLNRSKKYGDALTQIADGLTTDLTSKHIARVALGWE